MRSMTWREAIQHGGQGGSLVPPSTRGRVSVSEAMHPAAPTHAWNEAIMPARPAALMNSVRTAMSPGTARQGRRHRSGAFRGCLRGV